MTIVNRRTFVVKRGHMQDALNVLRNDKDTPNVRRVYRAYYGPFDAIAVELEFAGVAEMEQGWADWFVSERGRQFMEQWVQFVEPDGTNEVFLLE